MASQKEDLMNFTSPSKFVYDPSPIEAKVIAVFKDGHLVDKIDESGEIVLETTTFYALMEEQMC